MLSTGIMKGLFSSYKFFNFFLGKFMAIFLTTLKLTFFGKIMAFLIFLQYVSLLKLEY